MVKSLTSRRHNEYVIRMTKCPNCQTELPNPTKHGSTVSLPLTLTYATIAKPSSETTQNKENTVLLCSSRKNDTEKSDRKFNGARTSGFQLTNT
jgi:hypothetical protein